MAIQRARQHLVDFQIATNPKYEPSWHHDVIGRELEHIEAFGDRDYKILIVEVPPRHGKSQQCSIDFPAWFLGKNPSEEIITASYASDLSQDFGSQTRDKVGSPAFDLIFPNVRLKEDEQAKAKWKIETLNPLTKQWGPSGGSYTSVGIGGATTGKGAKIFLIDDPIKNREEADSEVYQVKTFKWFTSVAFTRLAPKGVMVIIMTRWNMRDLVGMVKEIPGLKGKIKTIHLPAIAVQKEVHRDVGEPLWPTRYDVQALEVIKNTVGPYDWASLYQCDPILSENQEFKADWIKKCSDAEAMALNTRRFLTVDTAMSKEQRADYTGFCDNRVDSQNFWRLKAWRMKLSPEELVDAIFNLHKRNNYEAIGIEKTTFTEGLSPYMDMEQRKRNVFLPIVELSHNQTKKEIRIRGLIPRYASHSIYHIEGETKDLEEEMFQFPVGMHDDVLDATAYQLQVADNPDLSVGGGTMRVNIPDLGLGG